MQHVYTNARGQQIDHPDTYRAHLDARPIMVVFDAAAPSCYVLDMWLITTACVCYFEMDAAYQIAITGGESCGVACGNDFPWSMLEMHMVLHEC